MSNQIPIFQYPGGSIVSNPPSNTTYKWIDELGGGSLPSTNSKRNNSSGWKTSTWWSYDNH